MQARPSRCTLDRSDVAATALRGRAGARAEATDRRDPAAVRLQAGRPSDQGAGRRGAAGVRREGRCYAGAAARGCTETRVNCIKSCWPVRWLPDRSRLRGRWYRSVRCDADGGNSLLSLRSQCGTPHLDPPRKRCRKGREDSCLSRLLQCPDSNRSLRTRQNSRCANHAPLIRVQEGLLRVNCGRDWAVRLSRRRMEGVFPKLGVHRLYHHPTGQSRP